ncbi:MAG: acyltransferase [Bacteroidota bacterium]
MRLIKNSKFKVVMSLLRFIIIKLYCYNKLHTKGLSLIGYKSAVFISGSCNIGKKAQVDDYVEIQSKGKLTIGDNFSINKYSRIICYDNISIGNNCVMAQFVSIIDHDHSFYKEGENIKFSNYLTSPISIGNNVWIADKVTILKGINIGSNVIIGANSVVTKHIPSNSIAAGNPCRVIKSI